MYSKCLTSFFFTDDMILFLKIFVIQLQLSAFSPHPSTPPQPIPLPSPTCTLSLDFVHVCFIVAPVNPSPHYPLPTPLWLLYFDLATPLLGLYPKNPETPIQKNLCTPMFIAAQFIIAKYWKQPKCPSANEWIKKLWYIYTMEFYTAERQKELIPFATAWIELESIMLSEIGQAVRDKYHTISPLTGT